MVKTIRMMLTVSKPSNLTMTGVEPALAYISIKVSMNIITREHPTKIELKKYFIYDTGLLLNYEYIASKTN